MRGTGSIGDSFLVMSCCYYCFPYSASKNNHWPGADVLVKSHHMQFIRETEKADQGREDLQWRMENVAYFQGGGVLLVRNPYDAIRLT